MRAFDAGVLMQLPSLDMRGGYQWATVRGYMLLFCADYPAAALMLPTAQSTGAHMPCRHCLWEKASKKAYSPASFLLAC